MKRETLRHPKLYDLMDRLDCSRPTALGYLDLLWDNAADIAPQGDLGKWPNGAIARSCDWTGNADQFVNALIEAGWLDHSEEFRLVIHDWEDHCQNWLRMKLQKLGLTIVANNQSATTEAAEPTADASAERSPETTAEASCPCDQTEPIQTKRNQPPPPMSAAANPAPANDSEAWNEVAVVFRNAGVNADALAAREFRQFGYSPAQAPELCAELAKRSHLGPGALVERIRKVSPDRPLSEGWPPASAGAKPLASGDARQKAAKQLDAINANAQKVAVQKEEAQRLEDEYGSAIDSTDVEELVRLLPSKVLAREKHAAAIRDGNWRKLPVIVRPAFVRAFAETRAAPTGNPSGHESASARRQAGNAASSGTV